MVKRVLLCFNHGTAARIECDNWEKLGYEVYLPKLLPRHYDLNNEAVTITDAYDKNLTIPPAAIALLDSHNFYDDPPSPEITRIVNNYFSVFYTCLEGSGPIWLCEVFKGAVFLRVFGLTNSDSYERFPEVSHLYRHEIPYLVSKVFSKFFKINFFSEIKHLSRATYTFNRIKNKLLLAGCYQNTADNEQGLFKRRNVWLPLGIPQFVWAMENTWRGSVSKIMFVCPTLNMLYYQNVFANFIFALGDLPHNIFGRQFLQEIHNASIKGFLSREDLNRAFQEYRCMFYHSTEPYHLHYHPLEAVVFGMPLIFMAGGLLEKLAGRELPGMARSYKEAREKLQRILDGDQEFVEAIVTSQKVIIESLRDEEVIKIWRQNLPPWI